MLAGIDSVFFEAFGIPKSVPVLSAAVLAAVFFICRKGIGELTARQKALLGELV